MLGIHRPETGVGTELHVYTEKPFAHIKAYMYTVCVYMVADQQYVVFLCLSVLLCCR